MVVLQRLLIFVLVSTFMLEAGLTVPPRASRRLRAGTIARAVLVMLVLGPLAAFGVAHAFAPTPQVVAALVLLAVVGVVPLAARGARSARGDMGCAVVLTLVLGIIAPFTAAPSARLLLRYEGAIGFEPRPILVQLLVMQIVPLALGLLVQKTSRRAAGLRRVVHILNIVAFAIVLAALLPRFGAVLEVGWRGVAAATVLAAVIAGVAHLVGGHRLEDRRALVSIANAPNVALALAIASSARAKPSFTALLLGVFLLRFATGRVLQRLVARRDERAARSKESVPVTP